MLDCSHIAQGGFLESQGQNHQRIVGSAEPLTPEETRQRLRELEEWGVDLSPIRASLQRTPTERVTRMLELLELSRELRRAYIAQAPKGKPYDTTEGYQA